MKQQLTELFGQALHRLVEGGTIAGAGGEIRFDHTRHASHGDLATNVALTLAKSAGRNPRDLAALIIEALPESPLLERVEVAGPGFINIWLAKSAHFEVVREIQREAGAFGRARDGLGQSVLLEFVSANPTGPLHVGHGRGAAYGDTLARLLRAAGYDVATEYYVNDAGRQMDILAVSVWLRYLELCDVALAFPDNCYQGGYVRDIADTIVRDADNEFIRSAEEVFAGASDLAPEAALDALIKRSKALLGATAYRRFFSAALEAILEDIHDDLEQFGVRYDHWYSEQSLHDTRAIDEIVGRLELSGHTYRQEGALWFRSTEFGDEKDRVLKRENGIPTYFAADIAYHADKFTRGFDRLVDIWGADHHGYIARLRGALHALGYDSDRLTVSLVQFAVLYRGGEKVSMSTRGGEFVTLRELRSEVGTDAARFFYVQRKTDQHMDFDLDLAKSQSNDNPVYYVQYAHARICSVFKQAAERGIDLEGFRHCDLAVLSEDHEIDLATQLARFPELLASAARNLEPHLIVYYLRDLANALHTYYNAHSFLSAPAPIRDARLALVDATRQVLRNGLELLGVTAPQQM